MSFNDYFTKLKDQQKKIDNIPIINPIQEIKETKNKIQNKINEEKKINILTVTSIKPYNYIYCCIL